MRQHWALQHTLHILYHTLQHILQLVVLRPVLQHAMQSALQHMLQSALQRPVLYLGLEVFPSLFFVVFSGPRERPRLSSAIMGPGLTTSDTRVRLPTLAYRPVSCLAR